MTDSDLLRTLLERVARGETSPEVAFLALQNGRQDGPQSVSGDGREELLRDDSGQEFARLDLDRAARQGFPEVIYCAGKTPAQVAAIAKRLQASGAPLLGTRADAGHYLATRELVRNATYHELARVITAPGRDEPKLPGTVGVVCAGTSDLFVAEEAAVCLQAMGARVERFADCGVAGLHRLLRVLPQLRDCDVLVCVAGMEGALVSVVAGLVSVPVVAVPTSVGYGANFGGVSALLTMLNSCASGVAVVNIDNGFGAAAFAASILRTSARDQIS